MSFNENERVEIQLFMLTLNKKIKYQTSTFLHKSQEELSRS
jgi:hypothetical protein